MSSVEKLIETEGFKLWSAWCERIAQLDYQYQSLIAI